MNKRMFTQEQINSLLSNKNVVQCSSKSISYDPKFKVLAVKQYYEEGLSPKQIFVNAGFNVSILGKRVPGYCLRDWRRIYDKKGAPGLLKDKRGKSKGGGRPKIRHLSDKEKIERLEATVAYLKAENDFLAKLRAAQKE